MKLLQSVLVLFVLCCSQAAHAQSYEIKIRPTTPPGEVQSAICKINQGTCFLTIPYTSQAQPEQQDYIDVAFRFPKQDFEADFMLKGHRLSLSQTLITHFKTEFHESLKERLSLFFPDEHAQNQKIAELELIVSPADL